MENPIENHGFGAHLAILRLGCSTLTQDWPGFGLCWPTLEALWALCWALTHLDPQDREEKKKGESKTNKQRNIKLQNARYQRGRRLGRDRLSPTERREASGTDTGWGPEGPWPDLFTSHMPKTSKEPRS